MRNLVLDRERREVVTPTLPTVVSLCTLTPQDVARALSRIRRSNPVAVCAVALLRAIEIPRDCDDGPCDSCERGLTRVCSQIVTVGARDDIYRSFTSRSEEIRSIEPTIVTASAVCAVPDSHWNAAQRRLKERPRTPESVIAYALARLVRGDETYDQCRRNVFVCISQLL